MLEPIKFLFILTGASTYLVTKYIKIGVDDPNNSTEYLLLNRNQSLNHLATKAGGGGGQHQHFLDVGARNTSAIARLGESGSSEHILSPSSPASTSSSSIFQLKLNPEQNGSPDSVNRYRDSNKGAGGGQIWQKPPSSVLQQNRLKTSPEGQAQHERLGVSGTDLNSLLHGRTKLDNVRPTFEIEINEEDGRDLPKRLLQVSLSEDDNKKRNNKTTTSANATTIARGVWPASPSIAYYIEGDGVANNLVINRTTGEIYVLRPLDRDPPEGRPQWRLVACAGNASDAGRVLGCADVVVYLRDVNDNVPAFQRRVYYANVSENVTQHTEIMQVTAIDLDDADESNNGRVEYSIELNQVDEFSGQSLFQIEAHTGVISTGACCLDREKKDNFTIKIAATDGGGLKSLATVVITLLDVNDEPPRFTQKDWHIEIDELDLTWSPELAPSNTSSTSSSKSILELTVKDADLPDTNDFRYKIVAQHFSNKFERIKLSNYTLTEAELATDLRDRFELVPVSSGKAELRVLGPLDYEIVEHKFIVLKVMVTDVPDEPWNTIALYHLDVAFIHIKLRDINDNQPHFAQAFQNVSLPESTALGTIIAKFYATDADQGGHAPLVYALDKATNRRKLFVIDQEGFVRLAKALDRETTPTHVLNVLAFDTDVPRLTSTATLVVNVEDVNDNAPSLVNITLPPIQEGSAPGKIGSIYAIDRDDYSRGNGPPFTFYIDPEASDNIKRLFRLEVDFTGEGRATLYSTSVLDREVQKVYQVPIVLRDSGYPPMTSVCNVTVIVGDVNDNEMFDAWKTVVVYSIQAPKSLATSSFGPLAIGRVNVDDADDWDGEDKVYAFADGARPSKLVTLDPHTGVISLDKLEVGVHELRFHVIDRKHHQEAHSSARIEVRNIPLEALFSAGSLRIVGTSAKKLIEAWDRRTHRKVVSLKDRLEDDLKKLVKAEQLQIFAINEKHDLWMGTDVVDVHYWARANNLFLSSVYLNSIVNTKGFHLAQLLSLNITQSGLNECNGVCETPSCYTSSRLDWSDRAHLVEANYTSFVGLKLCTRAECACHSNRADWPPLCDLASSCRLSARQAEHCFLERHLEMFTEHHVSILTPANSRCNQHGHPHRETRSFRGDGFLWLDPISVCNDNRLIIEMITGEPDGVLLYYGSLRVTSKHNFLLLELRQGRPRLLLNSHSAPIELTLPGGERLDDRDWHRLEVHFDSERIVMTIDRCQTAAIIHSHQSHGRLELARCRNATTIAANLASFTELFHNITTTGSVPLQVAGVANFDEDQFSTRAQGLVGCVRVVSLNGQDYDLSSPHWAHKSQLGCSLAVEPACPGGKCRSSQVPRCGSGLHGAECDQENTPIMLQHRAFVRFTMSWPSSIESRAARRQRLHSYYSGFSTQMSLSFRTRKTNAEIIRVMTGSSYAVLEVNNTRLAFRFNLRSNDTTQRAASWHEKSVHIPSHSVSDGRWHRVQMIRHGHQAEVILDNGGLNRVAYTRLEDAWSENSEQGFGDKSMAEVSRTQWPATKLASGLLLPTKAELQIVLGGVGGTAQFAIGSLTSTTLVNHFTDSCVNDLQINELHIPIRDLLLSKAPRNLHVDGVELKLIAHQNVHHGCHSSNNPCASLHCLPPFQCVDEFMQASCRCPTGSLPSGGRCIPTAVLCSTSPCQCLQPSSMINTTSEHCDHTEDNEDDDDDGNTATMAGDRLHNRTTTVNARIVSSEYGMLFIVIIALVPLNIPFLVYIIYICYRNNRRRRQAEQELQNGDEYGTTGFLPTSTSKWSEDLVRDNIVCYLDEGGGEQDVQAFNLIPLRVEHEHGFPSPPSAFYDCTHASVSSTSAPYMAPSSAATLFFNAHHQDNPNDLETWQELTVI